ncbi:hypothetical protein [Kitasatospora sp. NBC_00458]|uniref:hypothetical protein n=1 Tax=Kitasatospora sp. NBC_00458 TaxID=2903568 RepID=UPI002E17B77E
MVSPAVAPVALGRSSVIRGPEPSAPDEQGDGILTQPTRRRPRTAAAVPNTLDEIEYAPLRRVDQNPESTE